MQWFVLNEGHCREEGGDWDKVGIREKAVCGGRDPEWNVFVKIALSVLLLSHLGGCFMLLHCLRFGRGYTGVMVGILSVIHIVSTLSGVILECLRISGYKNQVGVQRSGFLSAFTTILLEARLVWLLCMAVTSLWMIRSAMKSLSKLDIEEPPVRRLSWKVWTVFACATITLPCVSVFFEVTLRLDSTKPRLNQVVKMMVFSVLGLTTTVAYGLM
ncbi:hypothetical protein PROFUN_12980, partial [Planoprotostelium fungivorum]